MVQRGYFCTGIKETEENLVPEMQSCKILDEILIVVRRVSRLASSLILNVTNNSCEQFNSVVNKFINRKRVNYSLRGSYTTRCEASVVSHNTSGQYLRMIHKTRMDDKSPGTKAMQYGIDNEPFAKAMLQLQMNIDVTNCGLFVDQDQPFLAARPDGLIGDDEIVEIKCPITISDLENLSSAAASGKVLHHGNYTEIVDSRYKFRLLKNASGRRWESIEGIMDFIIERKYLFDLNNAQDKLYIVTGKNFDEHEENFKLTCYKMGETAYKLFRRERFVDKSKKLFDKVAKMKMSNSQQHMKTIHTQNETSDALYLLDVARERGYAIDQLLCYELVSTSFLITKCGFLKKPGKASLVQELEKDLKEPTFQTPSPSPHTTATLFYFMLIA
uniref:YqaJ viral recombinase domain-containing protein n=1 Tax=Timema tahoe TaxID=61484 RepID=A0A7R9IMR7_9NEOP|nr:unnamed protein product [Timema tahoe]